MKEEVIDLSMEIYDGLTGSISEVKIMQEMTREWSGKHFKEPCKGWESRNIIISEHCGTHVDAPYHFVPDTLTIDQVPLNKFIGEAVLLDLRGIQKTNQPTERTHIIMCCEKTGVQINQGDIVILFSEQNTRGLTNEAVDWLIEKKIKAVGTNIFIEEDRVENGLKVRYAHTSFLSHGIPIFEDLINLDKIHKKRFTFIGLPLKIRKGTGSPIRAVALLKND